MTHASVIALFVGLLTLLLHCVRRVALSVLRHVRALRTVPVIMLDRESSTDRQM